MQNYFSKAYIKQHFHLENHHRNAVFHPLIISVMLSVVLFVLYSFFKDLNLWATWKVAGGNSAHFCESLEAGIIKQRANTWSNLAYLFVGFVLFSIGLKDHLYKKRKSVNNFLAQHPGFTLLLSAAVILLFLGSFLYHASMSQLFQIVDRVGIYAIVFTLIAYNTCKLFPKIKFNKEIRSSHVLGILLTIALTIFCLIEAWKWNINIIFPLLLLLLVVLNFVSIKKQQSIYYLKYMLFAFVSLFVAGSFWIMDRTDVICTPSSIWQGHALWHILTAFSVLLLYFYYRSEEMMPFLLSKYE